MNIFKTAVSLSGTGRAEIFLADTIKYDGKLWLVPTWLESPYLSYKLPERIICLDNLQYQKSDAPGIDFVLKNPIPKDVLYGQTPPESKDKYVVKMRPDIKVSFPTIH